MPRFRQLAALSVCLFLAGCPSGDSTPTGGSTGAPKGAPLDGTYHGTSMAMVLDFKGNKVKVNMMGESKELDYTIDGNTVTIIEPREGNLILTKNSDGTLTGPGGTFAKK